MSILETLFKREFHLPLQVLGFKNVPAIPIDVSETIDTLPRILIRLQEQRQALNGLSTEFTIQGKTETAYTFAFGKTEKFKILEGLNNLNLTDAFKELLAIPKDFHEFFQRLGKVNLPPEDNTRLSLDDPSQFSLSWSSFWNTQRDAGSQLLSGYDRTFTDADWASEQFFSQLSKNMGYNALFLKKVTEENITAYQKDFEANWTQEMTELYEGGLLYVIDFRIFSKLKPGEGEGGVRFTPGTFCFFKQDSETKDLKAIAIQVAGYEEADKQFYHLASSSSSAWLYAMQAVKTGVCVYGIFIGHLYYWHVPTAALIMTMHNTIPKDHPVYNLMAPQSKFINGWDNLLLLGWGLIAPPTSLDSPVKWIELMDIFCEDRTFFDDDPINTLKSQGLREEDFTVGRPWDKYPIAGYALQVWEATEKYVTHFVDVTYPTDEDVAKDEVLQRWIEASGAPHEGNVRGLPEMNSKKNLAHVLTSFIYRITIHGNTRMNNYINPVQTYVGNYPPCLRSTDIPEPNADFDTKSLLMYLPVTGQIGDMIIFYYTFADSAPYESFLPVTGLKDNLYFEGANAEVLNKGLIDFRLALKKFIDLFNEELKIPGLPPNQAQYQQWPLCIET